LREKVTYSIAFDIEISIILFVIRLLLKLLFIQVFNNYQQAELV